MREVGESQSISYIRDALLLSFEDFSGLLQADAGEQTRLTPDGELMLRIDALVRATESA